MIRRENRILIETDKGTVELTLDAATVGLLKQIALVLPGQILLVDGIMHTAKTASVEKRETTDTGWQPV